jgi:hypothetical protein
MQSLEVLLFLSKGDLRKSGDLVPLRPVGPDPKAGVSVPNEWVPGIPCTQPGQGGRCVPGPSAEPDSYG